MDSNRREYLSEVKQDVKDFIAANKVLIHYIRKEDKWGTETDEKVGVVVAFLGKDTKLMMGWSRCNTKAGDKFNRAMALYKALTRAWPVLDDGYDAYDPVPWSMAYEFDELYRRSCRYFKQLEVPA